ncbi:MAG: ABC transporter substrate-binding protein [Bdellovibrionota bacterium]
MKNLKGCLVVILMTGTTTVWASPVPPPIRVLLDQKPATLNPRTALDASGQRLGALLFRGLVRIDADLGPVPDIASSWKVEEGGRRWVFTLRPDLRDHGGTPIDARKMAECLESYRIGEPPSRLRGSFTPWKSTQVRGNSEIVLELTETDPYLERNLTLLRFFRVEGIDTACTDGPGPWVGSGAYRLDSPRPFAAPLLEGEDLKLVPAFPNDPDTPALQFALVRDDGTRALKLIHGEVEVAQNVLSLTKTRWVASRFSDRLDLLERPGVNVSYLAFNLKHPVLKKREVRRALAHAIDRESVIRNKMLGFGTIAGSLLAPSLPESRQSALPENLAFDRALAERILDSAGYPKKKDGVRFRLKYKTTSAREGIETALIFQNMFRKIGVELELDVVEPAVFLQAARKGSFEMYSSRWIGVSDGGILGRTLKTGSRDNRVSYSDPEMDRWLDAAQREGDLQKRAVLLAQVQAKMAEDLPYFPLWNWGNAMVLSNKLTGLSGTDLSRSGGYGPLTLLRWKKLK